MHDDHTGLAPAFDLSRVGYFLDFVLVPVAMIALLAMCSPPSTALIVLGVVAWSLAEYWIHRLLFHGGTPFEPMHQLHHRLPKDMIGVASWGTFAGFAAIWLLTAALIDVDDASAFVAGVMAGYLFYCGIHVRFHHQGEGARLSRYVAFMNRHHAAHHRGGRGNFGVSSPLWDIAFGTWQR